MIDLLNAIVEQMPWIFKSGYRFSEYRFYTAMSARAILA